MQIRAPFVFNLLLTVGLLSAPATPAHAAPGARAGTEAKTTDPILAELRPLLRTGRNEEAIALLRSEFASELGTERRRYLRGVLGDTYLLLDQPDLALVEYDAVVADTPDFAHAHFSRGLALQRRLATMPAAIVAFEQSRRLGKPDAVVSARIGFCYKTMAEYGTTREDEREEYMRQAVRNFEHALHYDPYERSALGNLADLRSGQGRFEEALELYERSHLLEPTDPVVLTRIAGAQLQLGDPPAALAAVRNALRLIDSQEPRSSPARRHVLRGVRADAHVTRARSLMALRRPEAARKELVRVLRMGACPDCTETNRQLDAATSSAAELLAEMNPVPAAADAD